MIPNGVITDPRPLEEKAKDYLHFAGASTPNWVEKTTFKRFTQRNQDGSSSCVFQAGAKALEVLTGKVISATPYFWRKNYPAEGSFLQDMGDIMYNRYSCTETNSPSQNQTEAYMNTIRQLTTNIGAVGYRTITDTHNIDLIAEAIEAYGQCVLIFHSNNDEWQVTPSYLGTPITFGHAICAVDYGLVNGKKVIVAEDSAGQFSSATGVRYITSDFLSKRCDGAMYFLGAKDLTIPQDTFKFNNNLYFGMMNNTEVRQLQLRLGVTPATGNFGIKTFGAVQSYQRSHGIIATGFCGIITRNSLNQ